jgi:Raf kinase inhibitor-like YbhB/YbcL family protein
MIRRFAMKIAVFGAFRCAMTVLLALAAAGSACSETRTSSETRTKAMSLKLVSPAFAAHAAIPASHTCEGGDVSPALQWSGIPAAARSLVLIVDDPDAPDPAAPQRTWVHWVLYNLPAPSTGLPEGVKAAQLPPGTREGLNDWKRAGYGGPCPPIGRHRYFHKLYALDIELPDLHQPDKARLLKAMEGHVIAQTELMGTYQKER